MNYIIAIGGTGCRCLESYLHLCAAGLGPDELFILIIDPDAANGNLLRTQELIKFYNYNRKNLQCTKNDPIFKTEIRHSDKLCWSPSENIRGGGVRFRNLLNYDDLSDDMKKLCRLFYTDREIDMELAEGFRGHTSVGAAAMATAGSDMERQPWLDFFASLRGDLGSGLDAKVFVMASLFGGTGASGFPTIGRLIADKVKNQSKNLKLGGGLVLPYFRFHPSEDQNVNMDEREELYANAEHFLLNTKAALEHYAFRWNEGDQNPYSMTYLVGDKDLYKQDQFVVGGPNQRNQSHYIELLTALAAYDFFENRVQNGFYYAGPDQEDYSPPNVSFNPIRWRDLPVDKRFLDTVRQSLLHFTSLGFAYSDYFIPLIRDRRFERRKKLIPWYVDHFARYGETLKADNQRIYQDDLYAYFCDHYFPWLSEIHQSEGVQLFNKEAFSFSRRRKLKFRHDSLGDLLLPSSNHSPRGNAYNRLWNKLCTSKSSAGEGTGKFVRLLYQAVESFCSDQYGLKSKDES